MSSRTAFIRMVARGAVRGTGRCTGPALGGIKLATGIAQVLVVRVSLPFIGQYAIGFVNDGCVPFVAAEIRMRTQLLHQCTVAGFNNFGRSVRLDMQNTVIVSAVFFIHASVAVTPINRTESIGSRHPPISAVSARVSIILKYGAECEADSRMARI